MNVIEVNRGLQLDRQNTNHTVHNVQVQTGSSLSQLEAQNLKERKKKTKEQNTKNCVRNRKFLKKKKKKGKNRSLMPLDF